MKKVLFTLMIVSCYLIVAAQSKNSKEVFTNPRLEEIVKNHKTVAILPFTTRIDYKAQPKNLDSDANKEKERSMALSIQSSLYTFLLRKSRNYTVEFQDVDKTNTRLKKAGMTDKLDEYTTDQIAKVLGVDAVISGKYETEQIKSEGGAIVTTVLFGGLGSKTGIGTLTMMVNDGATGDLLWSFFKRMNDSVFSSSDELIDRMMRKVSRSFPYSK